jgi:hypothetical protein
VDSLASDQEKLDHMRRAGLSEEGVAEIKQGRVPKGYEIHHKLSLDDGGTNKLENLILIKIDPYHYAMSNHQKAVTREMRPGETRVVAWPKFSGFFYSHG